MSRISELSMGASRKEMERCASEFVPKTCLADFNSNS